MNDRSA